VECGCFFFFFFHPAASGGQEKALFGRSGLFYLDAEPRHPLHHAYPLSQQKLMSGQKGGVDEEKPQLMLALTLPKKLLIFLPNN
jgi:hypothetical protein